MSNILGVNKKYQAEADRLLAETGLVESLEDFGQVHFTGAYRAGLMMHGDIDLYVVRKQPFSAEDVLEVLRQLYLADQFRSYFIKGNWQDPRMGREFPDGRYIGLKQKRDGETWKCDIWLLDQAEFEKRQAEGFNVADTEIKEDQKERILHFKMIRDRDCLPISSQAIYLSVLRHNCQSIEELKTQSEKNRS